MHHCMTVAATIQYIEAAKLLSHCEVQNYLLFSQLQTFSWRCKVHICSANIILQLQKQEATSVLFTFKPQVCERFCSCKNDLRRQSSKFALSQLQRHVFVTVCKNRRQFCCCSVDLPLQDGFPFLQLQKLSLQKWTFAATNADL